MTALFDDLHDWSHEPRPPKLTAARMALIARPLPPLHHTGKTVLRLTPGELWCECGESWPAGTTQCTRCGGRKFVEAAGVLRAHEYFAA